MSTTVLERTSPGEVASVARPRIYPARHTTELADVVSVETLVETQNFVWVSPDDVGRTGQVVRDLSRSYVGRIPSGLYQNTEHNAPFLGFRREFLSVKGAPHLYVSRRFADQTARIERVPGDDGRRAVTLQSVTGYFLEPNSYEFVPGKPVRVFRDFSYTSHEERWVIADIAFRCLGDLQPQHFEAVAELLKSLTNTPDTGDAEIDAHKIRVLNSLHRTYREEYIRRNVPWLLAESQAAAPGREERAKFGARFMKWLSSFLPR